MFRDDSLSDLYIKELETLIENIQGEREELYLYKPYNELICIREDVLVSLKEYEQSFSNEIPEDDFEMPYPDPETVYQINLNKLSLFSKLIYHKHFSFVVYKQMQRFGERLPNEFLSKNNKIIEVIKKNPKISYADILKIDIQLKVALDMLIENGTIYRAGNNTDTYWKINKQ